MSSITKYLVVVPLLAIIGFIDFIIGIFKSNKKLYGKVYPDKDSVLSKRVDPNDPKSPFRSTLIKDIITLNDPYVNVYDTIRAYAAQNPQARAAGARECLSVEDEVQPNGKVIKKFNLGQYKWMSYETYIKRVDCFSNGLLKLGLKSNDNLVIFSETRAEWIMSALACFKIKVPLVTLYATLGIDALAFGINETKVSYIIVSGDTLQKIEKILDRIPSVTHIIVIADNLTASYVNSFKLKASSKVNVFTMRDVEEVGATSQLVDYTRPRKDDLAVIMYTSGSTGNPKGVMITHGNLIVAISTLLTRIGITNQDTIVGYLPLAHVLELACELGCLMKGVSIGYSSIFTLTDNSTGIKAGSMGDLRVLEPTVMACVPLVLERLSKGVKDKLSEASQLKKDLFQAAYTKKLKKYKAGKSTVMLDKIVFNKIRDAILGRNIRCILSGGALLNREVQEFSQVCLTRIIQGYGLTETCGGGTTQLPNQAAVEEIGCVIECCEIRLVDWPEGGYFATDKPNPRGEIWIGGDNVTLGYYNLPDKTNEDYHIINGVRYFATGDIGEFTANGNLKIIDRKKDLVKLQGGEYVSLNKIEAVIKLLPFVDNCCVIANPSKPNCVCLITANMKKLEEIIGASMTVEKETGEKSDLSKISNKRRPSIEVMGEFVEMIDKTKSLQDKFQKDIADHCSKRGLTGFEIPTKAKFVRETWLPDTGLVTDSLKLKRKEIEKYYKKEIEVLYS